MLEAKPELKQCSRCHSTCALQHFDKNRQGEWFKTCNNCRSNRKEYRNHHKEEIAVMVKQWRNDNKDKVKLYNQIYLDRHNPLIECSHCKDMVRYKIIEDHQKGYQCNVFDMESKPDYHEWLFEHQTSFDDKAYLERIEQSQHNIISWKIKRYGTSSAVSDERLKELLSNGNDNIDYIWNWKEGPSNKTQIN